MFRGIRPGGQLPNYRAEPAPRSVGTVRVGALDPGVADTVYADTASGALPVSGTVLEGQARSGSPSGTVVVSGGRVEALRRSSTVSGGSSVSGSRTEALRHTGSLTASATVSGSRVEGIVHQRAVSGSSLVAGSMVEAFGWLAQDAMSGAVVVSGARVDGCRHAGLMVGVVAVTGEADGRHIPRRLKPPGGRHFPIRQGRMPHGQRSYAAPRTSG